MNTWEPAHAIINPKASPKIREFQARTADLVAVFKSGNSIPVNRTSVMKNNPDRIKRCIEALEAVAREF